MAWAALTVGLLEMTLGRHDAAREHLTEANELGGQFGNKWLESGARTQLASLAVRAGQLDEARAQLAESVDASEDTELSTQTVTFSLVAYAQLALAERDVRRSRDGLGRGRWAAPACGIAGVAIDAAQARRSWPPGWRRRSIPTPSRTPSRRDPSSINGKRSPSYGERMMAYERLTAGLGESGCRIERLWCRDSGRDIGSGTLDRIRG